jgi:hypothetical protein
VEYPAITESQLIVGIVGGLLGLIVVPLVGALLLWLTTKIFKFNRPSYPLSLACIFIAFGCSTAIMAVFSMLLFERIEEYAILFGLTTIVTGIVSEIVAVKFLFKESVWKSVGATVLSMAIGLVLYIAIITAAVFLFAEQIKAIFPSPV